MKISATSTLVLNWTDQKIWQREETLAYSGKLDLSEGEPLFKLFSEEETFMHTQAVSGRKYFMKQRISIFLEELKTRGESGQVIILAAGVAPLSIEIASLFPNCHVFDVDQYLMSEKKELVKGNPSNIEFIECDITNISVLNENLLKHGFKADEPTIAVMEGIIYYLPTDSFKNILSFLNNCNMVFAGDFCLEPELVSEKTRYYLTDVFRKIKAEVNLDFINFYTPEEITNLLSEAGYKNINLSNMQQIQEERVGETNPFIEQNSSWVMNISAMPATLV